MLVFASAFLETRSQSRPFCRMRKRRPDFCRCLRARQHSLGLYRDNGKENGNYRNYRGYIGIMDKKMETTIWGLGLSCQSQRWQEEITARRTGRHPLHFAVSCRGLTQSLRMPCVVSNLR